MLHYSLTSLLVIVLYVAIICAALVNGTGIWPKVAVTLTVGILMLSTLAAVSWQNRRRLFALGFSITGWIYFVLVFTTVLNVRSYLVTDSAVNSLYMTMHSQPAVAYTTTTVMRSVQTVQVAPDGGLVTTNKMVPTTISRQSPLPQPPQPIAYAPAVSPAPVDLVSFSNIGHSCWAIILALAGGIVSRVFYVRSHKIAEVDQDQDV